MRIAMNCAAVVVLIAIGPGLAFGQTLVGKPGSPGQIAAVSKHIAERNEGCRQEARAQKLSFLKRRRFIRDCKKANP